jgi:hypothetical protein
MNIIEQTEALKDLPDQRLMQEMQAPTGFAPQFLVLSELKRRKRMRDEYQRQQAADMQTVAEETITAAGLPQGGIMQMSRAMNPNSSIAQNTGMDQATQMQPTRMADGGVVRMFNGGVSGGTMSAIANLKANYPDLYRSAVEEGIVDQMAEYMLNVAQDVPYGLDALEDPRSFDFLKSMFTDPSNRAVSEKQREIEESQPERALQARIDSRNALSRYGDNDPVFAEGSVAEYLRGTPEGGFPRASEVYDISGTMVSPDVQDYLPQISGEQRFVLQRPPGAPLNEPTTIGGDRPSDIDASTFNQLIDVRDPVPPYGSLYSERDRLMAAQDAFTQGIGSLGGPLTMEEAAVPAALQRIESPLEAQVNRPMLVDQMATANIKDEDPMMAELARQAEIKRMMEMNKIPETSPEVGPISSALVDMYEAEAERIGSSFEAGVDALQSLTGLGGEGMRKPTPASELPEGFTLGDGTTAEGASSFGEMLSRPEDTSTAAAGNKTTGGQKASATSSLGGIEGRIAKMLEDKEKSVQSDKWMALAQAGMALMSSKEPTLAGAIGEAGLVGVGALKQGKAQYEKDVLDLLTLQQRIDEQRARASSKSGGLTASNMISLMEDLRNYKGDIQDRIDDLNDLSKIGTMSDEERAAKLKGLQAELMRTDIELGTYRNALRGGGSTTTPIDVRGGSQTQSGVGYSLGTVKQ